MDQELSDLGVSTVVIPRKGKPAKTRREHGRRFRRVVKWRTGSEERISYLKRRYGFDRTRLDDLAGAQTWRGLGVLAHNTVKIAHLIQTRQNNRPAPRQRTRAPGAGPPPSRSRAA